MKTKSKIIALFLACAAAAVAGAAGSHDHDHAAKITGPNKGRILEKLEPHAELFVTAERKVRLTFVDDAGKPVAAPAGLSVTLTTGERAAPVTLAFAVEGEGSAATLLSTTPLPEGKNLPAILRVKTAPDAAPTTIRLQLNLAQCAECDRQEYACACAH